MCELTGKCKEDFENWLFTVRNEEIIDGEIKYDLYYMFMYMLPENCKKQLIIEWLDSVEIYICIEPQKEFKNVYFDVSIDFDLHSVWSTRKEATNRAIEKANDIYNETHQKIN